MGICQPGTESVGIRRYQYARTYPVVSGPPHRDSADVDTKQATVSGFALILDLRMFTPLPIRRKCYRSAVVSAALEDGVCGKSNPDRMYGGASSKECRDSSGKSPSRKTEIPERAKSKSSIWTNARPVILRGTYTIDLISEATRSANTPPRSLKHTRRRPSPRVAVFTFVFYTSKRRLEDSLAP